MLVAVHRVHNLLSWSLTTCMVVSISAALWAQDHHAGHREGLPPLRVTHLGVDDGLSQGSVYCMLDDSRGFMWFTSYEGLNRFDGQRFRIYTADTRDPNALIGSNTIGLVEDPYGNIWTGTEICLNRYRRLTDDFDHLYAIGENGDTLKSLHYPFFADSSEVWYINDAEGIMAYDYLAGNKRLISDRFLYDRSNYIINSTVRARSGDVWVRKEKGLVCIDPVSGQISWYFSDHPTNKCGAPMKFVCAIETPGGELCLGYRNGLMTFDPQSCHIRTYDLQEHIETPVADIRMAEDGTLWLGTEQDGLLHFSLEKGVLQHFRAQGASNRRLTNNTAATLHLDRRGLLWVGVDPDGIDLLQPDTKPFLRYGEAFFEPSRFTTMGVRCFAETANGHVWIGTQEDGLILFDPVADRIVRRVLPGTAGFTPNNCADLLYDSQGRLWVGTYDGLFLSENGGERFRQVVNRSRPESMRTTNFIWYVLEVAGGNILFSTDEGVYVIPAGSLDPQPIMGMEHADGGTLFATDDGYLIVPDFSNGMYIMDLEQSLSPHETTGETTGASTSPPWHHLTGFNVKHVYPSPEAGLLWVATNTGLLKVRHQLDWSAVEVERHYLRTDGLPSDYIYGILPAPDGKLWMSTNRGMTCFDPATEQFQNYGPKDGVQGYEFNTNAYMQHATGELYFGGTQGFNRFDPSAIRSLQLPPEDVQIIDFEVNDQKWKSASYIGELAEVELAAWQNTFTVHVAAIDYYSNGQSQYRVKLVGYDDEWLMLGTQRQVRYTQVEPGRYTFLVQAANRDGWWMENTVSRVIHIRTPWYQTWWAWLAYLTVGLFLFWELYLQYQRRRSLRIQLEQEHREAERLKELDEAKSRLFTNITHEFRTPLTVILGLAEEVEKNPTFKTAERLQMLKKNGRHLLKLVNQLLDLARMHSSTVQLDLTQADVVAYLQVLTDSYQSFAFSQKIGLQFFSEERALLMDFDPNRLQHILDNLLSNAFKFTPAYGQVLVFAKKLHHGGDDWLEIRVKDNGAGIASEEQPKVFDRFYRAPQAEQAEHAGTGIGLALVQELVGLMGGQVGLESELGKGTTFFVLLPIRNTAPLADQVGQTPRGDSAPEGGTFSPIAFGGKNKPALHDAKPIALIIEDNADVLYYIQECLRSQWQVITAANGKSGLALAYEFIPDIIISDVMMPDVDGFTVCEELKSDERTSHIPVLLLTAKATQEDKIEGLRRGADAYLVKPFSQTELLQRLDNFVKLRQSLQRYLAYPGDTPPTPESIFLAKVTAVIETHLSDADFTSEQLGRELGLSRSQLHRKLKALTGQSTSVFVRTYRLHRASDFLRDSDLSVSEVAWKTGFGSLSWFSQAFREEFGCAPSAMRK